MCLSIDVTHVKCFALTTKGKKEICTVYIFFLFTLCLTFSFIPSRCVTAIVISLVIDHSSGWAPATLPLLEIWLRKDSINFHLKEHACFQWDTEHLCRPERDNESFSKATEICLPVYHDTGSKCKVIMSFTQTAIHFLKIFWYYCSFKHRIFEHIWIFTKAGNKKKIKIQKSCDVAFSNVAFFFFLNFKSSCLKVSSGFWNG